MTEELNQEIKEEQKCKCICCSEGFSDCLKIALGSFIGVFFALTLFAALHKPPMPPCPFGRMMPPPIHQGHHFYKNKGCPFQKMKMERRDFDKQIPVRIEVEQGK